MVVMIEIRCQEECLWWRDTKAGHNAGSLNNHPQNEINLGWRHSFSSSNQIILRVFIIFRNFGLDILIHIDEGRYGGSANFMRT